MVYLDNAATTKPYTQVVEKMRLIDEQVWGNPSSIHYTGTASQNLQMVSLLKQGLLIKP